MFGGNLCTGVVLCTRCVLVKFRHTRDHDTGFGWNYAVSTWCMLHIISIGTGLLWGYGLLKRGYILLCHTKVINRHVTESEDMLLLFRQLYNAYP